MELCKYFFQYISFMNNFVMLEIGKKSKKLMNSQIQQKLKLSKSNKATKNI